MELRQYILPTTARLSLSRATNFIKVELCRIIQETERPGRRRRSHWSYRHVWRPDCRRAWSALRVCAPASSDHGLENLIEGNLKPPARK